MIESPTSTLSCFAEFESVGSKSTDSESFVIALPSILSNPGYGWATILALSFMNSILDIILSTSRWACPRVQGLLCGGTGNTG